MLAITGDIKKFTIPQGRHFARGLHLNVYIGKSYLKIRGRFGDSCRYNLASKDHSDINKLTGLTPGFLRNKNSARLGWRYDLGRKQVELMYYCHIKGDREFGSLGFVDVNMDFEASIEAGKSGYHFKRHNPGSQQAIIKNNKSIKMAYRNVPYFGGNQTAPHDLNLWVEVVEFK